MSKPHIMLLDEPTNHLNMQSIDALADALDKFTGGVVLVSHDSRLIAHVCEDEEKSEIWVVQDGTVKTFAGTFEEYKQGGAPEGDQSWGRRLIRMIFFLQLTGPASFLVLL